MKYDFTTIIDRVGKDAMAVEAPLKKGGWITWPELKEGFDFIPMWVADMNFATAPSIIESIKGRLEHPLFGYYAPKDEYFDCIIHWQETHHKVKDLPREAIGYENGVHGFVTSAIEVLTEPGDKVLLHSPVYVGFSSDVEGLGRTSVYSPLKKDENGVYRMDYEDMDKKIKENNIHTAIFCSPHNPAGRVWERWELEKAMEVYEKNEVLVISDEIWADLTMPGHQHIPTQQTNAWAKDHVVACYAPSKTFNLAGMIGSYHVIYNKYLRDRITAHAARTHYNSQHILSMYALMGAYSDEGAQWVDELRETLNGNLKYATDFFHEHLADSVDVTMPQGTYMLFLDVSKYLNRTGKTLDELIKTGQEYGVGWQDGRGFQGPTHIRLNVALPLTRVQEALDRMVKHVFVG